jgi:hypothetical protein
MTEEQVREVIRESVANLGGMRAASRAWKVSVAYVSDVLGGRRAPGPAILSPVGYVREVRVSYVPVHGMCQSCGWPNRDGGVCSRPGCCGSD